MVNVQEFLKEAKSLSLNAKSVIEAIMRMNYEKDIPNITTMNDNHVVFNVRMSEAVKELRMNFSIYEAGINSYLLELVSYFPQEDFVYPEGVNPKDAEFILSGAPALGAHHLQKPISSLSLQEAIEAALEYVYDNMEDIMKEILGGESITGQ